LATVVDAVVARHPYKFSTHILTAPSSSLDQAFPPLRAAPKHDGPAAAARLPKRNEAVALSSDEAAMLERGDFACALDAEFVVLEEAETEESSDGTYHVRRPPVYTMARLSAVRANGGPLHGVPFIDDYVATTRVVADLVTQFSGIHIGDLTLGISAHQLSTMKEAYRKLRLLVDSGCTIIGHGLARDFRVSNITVPAAQVRDTMLLFQSSANPRALSLRFLYWYFYKKAIQSGEHSSVEDSQATLKVYESYLQAKDESGDRFAKDVVDAIYAAGERMSWQLPDSLPAHD
ncbi:poly(A)-specific ribonuclease, partial [Coemansia helicoidea]